MKKEMKASSKMKLQESPLESSDVYIKEEEEEEQRDSTRETLKMDENHESNLKIKLWTATSNDDEMIRERRDHASKAKLSLSLSFSAER